MSRADQSFTKHAPKTCERKSSTATLVPSDVPTPTTNPTSASKSSRVDGPKVTRSIGVLRLPARSLDRRAADDDRAGAAVVADRHVFPVRTQRRAVRPQDPADVRSVVARRIEVDVVGDLERHQFGRAGKRTQRLLEPFVRAAAHGVEQCAANVCPHLRAGFEEMARAEPAVNRSASTPPSRKAARSTRSAPSRTPAISRPCSSRTRPYGRWTASAAVQSARSWVLLTRRRPPVPRRQGRARSRRGGRAPCRRA